MYTMNYTTRDGQVKHIHFRHGDVCQINEEIDLLICSAYIGGYGPTPGSLIGSLLQHKGISVSRLARNPQLDLKSFGGWLSEQTGCNIRRIACIELINWHRRHDRLYVNTTMLKRAFSTVRFLVEQTVTSGIPVRNIYLPLLGCGQQGIEPEFIVSPLMEECLNMLENIDQLRQITFFELNPGRLQQMIHTMQKLLTPPKQKHDIFISYSTKNLQPACHLKDLFHSHGYTCWMAPDSIPLGSSYLDEISQALHNISAVALLLTPEAETSRWVPKEIGTAISRGIDILPCQMLNFTVSDSFSFLLEGIQIFRGWQYSESVRNQLIIEAMSGMLSRRNRR